MNPHFDPIQIMQKVSAMASAERKIVGGSYEVTFYFAPVNEFMVFTSTGLVLAKGKDKNHTYVKPWEKSLFAQLTPEAVLEKYSSQMQEIEIKSGGNAYHRSFNSYGAFLNWLGFPRQLDLLPQQTSDTKE